MKNTHAIRHLLAAGFLASALTACGEDSASPQAPKPEIATRQIDTPASGLAAHRIDVAPSGPAAQPVPEALSRQVIQSLGASRDVEVLGFFPRGTTSDGRELFTVIRRNSDGEKHASVAYDPTSEALQGCLDETCERGSMAIAFTPVKSHPDVRMMGVPSPACMVVFYEHANFGGYGDCYGLPQVPYYGSWLVTHNGVIHNDAYSSHKTYDQFCREQGLSSDCTQPTGNPDTNGSYVINVTDLRVFKNSDKSGYDRWLGDWANDFNRLRWCDLCGDINDKISSFEAYVRYSRQLVGTASGSLAQGQEFHFYPLSVLSGTRLRVVMSGTNDPDLYVRFGTNPTTSAYDCRPYTGGADETCDLEVPAGQGTAYIMVRGYTASTYNLTVNFVEP
jgi:Bacterial pre-peptidase C-terminal domain